MGTILGENVLQNLLTVYDYDNNRIGIAPTNCAQRG